MDRGGMDSNRVPLHRGSRYSFISEMPGRSYSSVLDLGGRDGSVLNLIDSPSKFMVDLTPLSDIPGVQIVKGDLEKASSVFEGLQRFDLVLLLDVLEHVESKVGLVRTLIDQSPENIIISLPNTQYYKYIEGLVRGRMSKQYVFDVLDHSDRHRWITYYKENTRFINKYFSELYEVHCIDITPHRRIPLVFCNMLRHYLTSTQVYVMRRRVKV